MTDEDEKELHRLCAMLKEVHKGLDESPLSEAVMKASFGLTIAFIHGHRAKVEDWALGIGRPLDEAQREHLQSMGISPDGE